MIADILGLGCDILDVSRIEKLLERDQGGFVKRVLTEAERQVFDQRLAMSQQRGLLFLATRFSAKEAFSKAMGTGIGEHFSFQDLSVLNVNSGEPVLVYSEKLGKWLQSRQAFAKISLSDEKNHVMSTVILYSKQ